jgi:predicted sugar kinase
LVLVAPRGQQGPFGHREDQLFRDLPAVDPRVASTLRLLLQNRLVPAARDANFEQLSAAIYEFGFLAGTCYERFQDGPFHSPTVQRAVELIRSLGITGVGQSSWGPCVFALCQSAADAASLLESLRNTLGNADFWFEISPINNRGYSVSECVDQPSTMEEPG